MGRCLDYNELSKDLPKLIKKIFDKSRREHNILKSNDKYENIFNELVANKSVVVTPLRLNVA